jgi:predicted DsbA family dithiol-disulfide isomerase
VNVEIWSDIACPWCYVGKRRFEAALERFEHRDQVTVTWRSFELDPSAPSERPESGAEHLASKYGTSVEQARAMEQKMTDTAAGDGLDFRFDKLRLGNTFDAHRVVHLAQQHGLQDAMKERLMRAYLTEGRLIADHEVLLELAAEVGLPEAEVREVLLTERFADEVRDDERTAAGLGIHGVPFFVVDRKIAASGAQPPEVLVQLLEQAMPTEPVLPVVADGAACGPDGC